MQPVAARDKPPPALVPAAAPAVPAAPSPPGDGMDDYYDDWDDWAERFRRGFADMSSIGEPTMAGVEFISNERLMKLSPERFNFYMQLKNAWESGGEEAMEQALGVETMSKFARERVDGAAADIAEKMAEASAMSQRGGGQAGGAYWKDMYDKMQAAKELGGEERREAELKLARSNLNDPFYSPKVMEATLTDRIVFIAATYVLRSISLTLVQWAINSRLVNTIVSVVVMYVVVYLMFFAFWVLVVNASERDLFLHMVFYYVNTKGDKGSMRIWLHALVAAAVLPVPFVIQNRPVTDPNPKLSYEDKVRAASVLENVSFATWLIGAVIALRF